MLTYAPLRPGPGFRPFRAGCYMTQRLVTRPTIRCAVAAATAATINRFHSSGAVMSGETAGEAAESRRILYHLQEYGYALLPRILSGGPLAEINAYLARKKVVLRSGERVDPSNVPATATIADLPLEDVLRCPGVISLMNDPRLIRLAVRFLGCLPTISTVGIRWSFPAAHEEASTQAFHRDTDDWHFFKVFVYLTDVDAASGPHLYVPGSHLRSGTIRARKVSEGELERDYGDKAVVAITGQAGTNFVMNGYGIHAGPVPIERMRLMLEVGYSVLPSFALNYSPLRISPSPPVDRYVNRLLLDFGSTKAC